MAKYVFVTGGVVSGLGKGITAASLGRLLKCRGYKVAAQKLDPYINVDPGTMSPLQHGEVFVTEDGAETDLDLGHYERFIDENLNKYSNLTTGKVYKNVIEKERRGEYLGSTVQVIPHITEEIKSFIYNVGTESSADIIITEIGGTVGDIESQPYLDSIRQVALEQGKENCLFIHVTLVPYLRSSGEHKSKPTQHSVKELRAMGINPDIIVMRSDEPIEDEIRRKISNLCNIKEDCVIENSNVEQLYEAPLMLEENDFSKIVCRELGIPERELDIAPWRNMIAKAKRLKKEVNIALVGKYVQLRDAYLSVAEALKHAGYENDAKVNIGWIDSEQLTDDNAENLLGAYDGIIVPGGFGDRGVEGMVTAASYARYRRKPYFGICLGMQVCVIEFARNVLGFRDANSSEFSTTTKNPVIHIMEEQIGVEDKGGTMRLGTYPCKLLDGTVLREMYGQELVMERHRHRYEFNTDYGDDFEANGMILSGQSPDGSLIEAVELKDHPFFVGLQAHPEFKSRPNRPHPVFCGFIKSALRCKEER